MNVIKQFKDGLNVGLFSFGFLWKHKSLILYLSIPKLIGIIISLTVYNLFFVSPPKVALILHGAMNKVLEKFGGMQHIILLLVEVVTILVTIFATAALTHHVFALLKKRKAGIIRSLQETQKKLKPILIWSVISAIVFFLIHKTDLLAYPHPDSECKLLFAGIAITARVVWSLPFLFVIPLIALQEKPLLKIVKKSPQIIKKMFIQYCGALSWVGLITLLAITPLYLIYPQQLSASGIQHILMATITFSIATAHGILKTVLYKKDLED